MGFTLNHQRAHGYDGLRPHISAPLFDCGKPEKETVGILREFRINSKMMIQLIVSDLFKERVDSDDHIE